jgi:hypothetical protein
MTAAARSGSSVDPTSEASASAALIAPTVECGKPRDTPLISWLPVIAWSGPVSAGLAVGPCACAAGSHWAVGSAAGGIACGLPSCPVSPASMTRPITARTETPTRYATIQRSQRRTQDVRYVTTGLPVVR